MRDRLADVQTCRCRCCGESFFVDASIWNGTKMPYLCPEHLQIGDPRPLERAVSVGIAGLRAAARAFRPRREEFNLRKLVTAERAMAIDAVATEIVTALRERDEQIHISFARRGSGNSTRLPLKIVRSLNIERAGPVLVVEPFRDRVLRYAAVNGGNYYGVSIPTGGLPAFFGPYMAVGCEIGGYVRSSWRNLLTYATGGVLLRQIEHGLIGRYGVIVLGEPTTHIDSFCYMLRLLRHVLDRYPRLKLLIGSEGRDEDRLLQMLGGRVVVHRLLHDSPDAKHSGAPRSERGAFPNHSSDTYLTA